MEYPIRPVCVSPAATSLTAHRTLWLGFAHTSPSQHREGRDQAPASLTSEPHLAGAPHKLAEWQERAGILLGCFLLCHKEEDIKTIVQSQIIGPGREIITM